MSFQLILLIPCSCTSICTLLFDFLSFCLFILIHVFIFIFVFVLKGFWSIDHLLELDLEKFWEFGDGYLAEVRVHIIDTAKWCHRVSYTSNCHQRTSLSWMKTQCLHLLILRGSLVTWFVLLPLCFLISHAKELFCYIAEDALGDLVKCYWDLKLICAIVIVYCKNERGPSVKFLLEPLVYLILEAM